MLDLQNRKREMPGTVGLGVSRPTSATVATRTAAALSYYTDDELRHVQNFFDALLQSFPGLRTVMITDREGLSIFRSPAPPPTTDPSFARGEEADAAYPGGEDPRVYQALTTVFSLSSDQAAKIPALGKVKQVLSYYDEGLILQINEFPLVVTFHGSLQMNVGELLEVVPSVRQVVQKLKLLMLKTQPRTDELS